MNAKMRMQRSGIPILPMTDLLWLTIFTIPITVAVGFLITYVISRWTNVSVSAMEIMAGLGAWYVAILAGWSAFTHIPLFVTSGKTRKYAWKAWLAGMIGLSVLSALMVAIAYVLERAMYNSLDWTPGLDEPHLFESGYQMHLVFFEYLLSFAVMGAIGGFVGISVYRSRDWGWGATVPAVILAALAGVLEGGNIRVMGFISQDTFGVDELSTAIKLILMILIAITAAGMAFSVAKDVPIRNR